MKKKTRKELYHVLEIVINFSFKIVGVGIPIYNVVLKFQLFCLTLLGSIKIKINLKKSISPQEIGCK